MPRVARHGLTAVLLAVLFAPLHARAADFDPKPVDEVVDKALKAFRVPGAAVVVVQDGKVVYLKGFGVRKKDSTEKVTPDTVFAIASCSKAFTATATAMLVAEGKLGWDDKVHDRLDYFRLSDELADREVTLRDLLCHRTGMPRHDWLWSGLSTDTADVIHRFGRAKSSTSFRSTWEYSNIPFTTAGVIVGKAAKSDWAGVIRKRIFEPLEMSASSCTVKEGQTAADHATPHYLGVDKAITPVEWDEIDHAGGAGCVNSTAHDMGNWLRFQLSGGVFGGKRLLPTQALKETHSPQMLVKPTGAFAVYFPAKATHFTNYGLGWFVHDYRGHIAVSHGGTLTGFRAQVMMVPQKKIGVCVVCNLRPSYFPEAVAKSVLDQLLELEPEDWVKFHQTSFTMLEFKAGAERSKRAADRKPDTLPSREPAAYRGRYEHPAYGRATVVVVNDKTTLEWGRYTFRLDHYHYDTYTAVPVEPKEDVLTFDRSTLEAQFRLGSDGEVESLKFLGQEFRRKK